MAVQAVTTRNKPAPFAWSYSKLKNFETCPKRHLHIDIKREYKEESEHLSWGNAVHAAFAEYFARQSKGLPQTLEPYKAWIDLFDQLPGDRYTEQKLAITEDLDPCGYFDKQKQVWFRSVADLLVVHDEFAVVVDWKTGKIKEDNAQLFLMAACVFAKYPQVKRIQTMFVWLAEDANTKMILTRDDMPGIWSTLLPRVKALRHAYDTQEFPPTPNGLCRKYCPVISCPHNGV